MSKLDKDIMRKENSSQLYSRIHKQKSQTRPEHSSQPGTVTYGIHTGKYQTQNSLLAERRVVQTIMPGVTTLWSQRLSTLD